jgi:hypothetical protein
VVLWQIASARRLLTLPADGPITEIRFSADSRTLVFGGEGGTLHRARLASGEQAAPPRADGHAAEVLAGVDAIGLDCGPRSRLVGISGNGARVAVAGDDGMLCLYDTNGTRLARVAAPTSLVALSDDGGKVAAIGLDRRLHWLDVAPEPGRSASPEPTPAAAGGQARWLRRPDAPAQALVVSPQGSYVALSTWKPGAEVRKPGAEFSMPRIASDSTVEAIAFNRAETYLVTGGSDANARVWLLPQSGQPARELARIAHRYPVTAVALSADDELLVTASGSLVRVLRWRQLDLAGEACARLHRNLTPDEWEQYLPGWSREQTCNTMDEVRRGEAGSNVERAGVALSKGHIPAAVALYRDAAEAGEVIDAAEWNRLCWTGSLWGYPREVLFACEQGVADDPDEPAVRDSRGLAHALLGNRQAAIDDFRVFVERGADDASPGEIAQRRSWIEVLAGGGNPLTPHEIRGLREP